VPLTQPELESRLWDAADSLGGPVDPGDFMTCVVPLLSFERISDALE
jgi:type I restriction enzyme M protein